jgi:putative ABC transport system permease protein
MTNILNDLAFALRQLRKSPGFAITAVLTLALGIGANAALFTVIDSVLIRSLPYYAADRLIIVGPPDEAAGGYGSTSWRNLQDIRQRSRVLEDAAGYEGDVAIIQTAQGGETVSGPKLTWNLLNMIGAKPAIGRGFTQADGETGAPPTAILSDQLWRAQFKADPKIVGQVVRIGDVPHTVIGVMPPEFQFPDTEMYTATEAVWLPFQPTKEMMTERGYNFLTLIGRLKRGVSLDQARADLGITARSIAKDDPKEAKDLRLIATPFQNAVTQAARPVFLGLLAALALVLLIACANVANLQLARCLARQQEFAVRTALGADRWRLIRQLLVEGGLLSVLGSAVGLGLSTAILWSLHKLPGGMMPRASEIHLRFSVLAVLAVIAIVVTLLSSLLPVLLAWRVQPETALRGQSRASTPQAARSRMAGWLVSGEVAIAAILLVATGLLFHTLYNLEHQRLGFETQHVITFTATPPDSAGYLAFQSSSANAAGAAPAASIANTIYRPLLDRLRHLPGVRVAALASSTPLDGVNITTSFDVIGQPKSDSAKGSRNAKIRVMSGDYSQAIGTTIVKGRAISDDDTASAPFVAVINQALADRYFRNVNPIGQQVDLSGKDDSGDNTNTGMLKPYTVVGVLENNIRHNMTGATEPELTLSYQQVPRDSLFYPIVLASATQFILHTSGDVDLSQTIHRVIHETAPGFAVDDLKSMQSALDDATGNQRLGVYLIGSFAALAALMVMAGLYGVLSQLVSQRQQEVGIRIALGATRESILTLFLRQSWRLIAVGIVGGLVASVLATRLVQSFLFNVPALDPLSYIAAALGLALVGTLAALIPARRASRVEPMVALRNE